jgi:hypothetical protein
MDPDPLHALAPAPNRIMSDSYFATVRNKLNHKTLRDCQTQAFAALAKGRPATLKQFAKVAAPAANHWFCGDLSGLYAAIGEKISERPTRGSIIPQDRLGYVSAVYALLGGQHFERRVVVQSRDVGQGTTATAFAQAAGKS